MQGTSCPGRCAVGCASVADASVTTAPQREMNKLKAMSDAENLAFEAEWKQIAEVGAVGLCRVLRAAAATHRCTPPYRYWP